MNKEYFTINKLTIIKLLKAERLCESNCVTVEIISISVKLLMNASKLALYYFILYSTLFRVY